MLPKDWNLNQIFTQKRESVDVNWGGVVAPNPQQFQVNTGIHFVSHTHAKNNCEQGRFSEGIEKFDGQRL